MDTLSMATKMKKKNSCEGKLETYSTTLKEDHSTGDKICHTIIGKGMTPSHACMTISSVIHINTYIQLNCLLRRLMYVAKIVTPA